MINNQNIDDKYKITLLSNSYIASHKRIEDSETNIFRRSAEDLRASRIIVSHMESVTQRLDPKERIIIENEVLMGKKGKWYLEFFSASAYYRARKKAYRDYLRIIEQ